MNPARLAIVAALIGVAIRLVKSEAINVLLAKFGKQPIPKVVLPQLALLLGAAAGLVQARVAGVSIPDALPNVLDGLVSGALAVAGNESFSVVAPKVIGAKASSAVFGVKKPGASFAPPQAVDQDNVETKP